MLTTRRPTPTTVAFTVSTASPKNTVAAIAPSYFFIALRILLGLYVCTALLFEGAAAFPGFVVVRIAATFCQESFGLSNGYQIAQQLSNNLHVAWRLVLCAGLGWIVLRRGYTEESLLVVRGLGVQTSSTGSTWLATTSTRFIPTSAIQDILIHEAFKGFEVRFYMAIVVAGGEDAVVVFPVSSQVTLLAKGAY
ncbi:uncharacterized protein K489DRAFT_377896 [Dissoconium aciculare CBS 342.82]|uniref:Phosphatidylinositol N-acetylglucosaminyltransferase subunit H conserved domain-containing protein n=1 Tax=Dissoconium aciculare CBS 342.82 TaxID=1314786 RepID=A0A6J3MBF8_9PEZI|nr:uncharacterized protein K489DRAFT_377896 [Dissoconium aciculare CBS 342.82]KAF1825345.1 hypothetical protein K489DRAFT_377896 [Dissoconium aciculare CBS 342.82]